MPDGQAMDARAARAVMAERWDFFAPTVETDDWVLFACLVAIIVLLMGLVAFPAHKKGRSVLLIGPEDSGKTTLFMRLKDGLAANVGAVVPTVFFKDETFDIELPRVGGAKPPQELVNVIDTPSDSDAIENVMSKITRLAAIVCMVDLSEQGSCAAAAELLYRLFTAKAMRDMRVPTLIACNKSDVARMTMAEMRQQLEAEIDRVQKECTAKAKDQAINGRSLGPNVTMINLDGEPFNFSKAPTRAFEMVECSALVAKTEEVVEFICKHVPQLAAAQAIKDKRKTD
uniref:Signal recognition particle receptor subunit beta n=2 Tax=Diacronema lutheri TaxID=2081491 RepID=A0A7R9UXA3_DIALT|mmetsp:Transcript_7890/g.24942  ORF Transcript_7890/g.24942 Transcript_7890/m.24942 type:complete len:286 (+) Transcript_7890:17-874(+)